MCPWPFPLVVSATAVMTTGRIPCLVREIYDVSIEWLFGVVGEDSSLGSMAKMRSESDCRSNPKRSFGKVADLAGRFGRQAKVEKKKTPPGEIHDI